MDLHTSPVKSLQDVLTMLVASVVHSCGKAGTGDKQRQEADIALYAAENPEIPVILRAPPCNLFFLSMSHTSIPPVTGSARQQMLFLTEAILHCCLPLDNWGAPIYTLVCDLIALI